ARGRRRTDRPERSAGPARPHRWARHHRSGRRPRHDRTAWAHRHQRRGGDRPDDRRRRDADVRRARDPGGLPGPLPPPPHPPPGLIAIQGGFETPGETVTVNDAVSAYDASISVPDPGDPGQWDFTIVTSNNHSTRNSDGFPTFPVTIPVTVVCAKPGN